MEHHLTQPEGLLVVPDRPTGTGVLVLSGSSGRIEADRCRVLSGLGATALSVRWFGGPGQQPAPYEVPLETFTDALDRLARSCDRLVVTGTSFGAEAALLTAVHDPRVAAVVAVAPSPVVWAGVDGDRQTSHWTRDGHPLPFVPFDEDWAPDEDPPSFRGLYERSLALHPDAAAAARIPVERIAGEVVVVGGEDDRVWPGADFARRIAADRSAHDLPTTVVVHPEAGHHAVLPGEQPPVGGTTMARGGTEESARALGDLLWPHLQRLLG